MHLADLFILGEGYELGYKNEQMLKNSIYAPVN